MLQENRDALFETLKVDEGVKNDVYLDHLGYKTVGVGHLILPLDPEAEFEVGDEISDERVRELFEQDLETCIAECVVLYDDYWEDFPGEVKEILANMMFNMGRPRLSKFKNFKAKLEAHDWADAAAEGRDSVWYRQVTNRAERLMSRLEEV